MRFDVVDSTQRVAFDLADGGAADGTVVVADFQTAGRGRRGRAWHAEPGTSLLASIVVRPSLPVRLLPLLSLAAAVAVAEALVRAGGVAARLAWPNDVVIGGRKVAGILLESRLAAAPLCVVGVGVNVGARRFPGPLAARATSLAIEAGRAPDRDALLDELLRAFVAWRARLEREGFAPVRDRWLALSETIGRTVVRAEGTGVAVGLDDDGALLVRAGGAVHRIVAGDLVEMAGSDLPALD